MSLRKRTIRVQGMHCKNCVDKIEQSVGSIKGVKRANVNLAEDQAIVSFNPDKTSLKKINAKIRSLGYGVGNSKINKEVSSSIWQGIAYGLLPHTGCIAFLLGSILGVTVLMQFFRPLLMNRYFFHFLMLLSLGFASLSTALYLRKNGLLSKKGIKKKWKYVSTMYGSTIGINLILFMIIFPMLANVSAAPNLELPGVELSSLALSVDIPCPGHAPLISGDLRTIEGVTSVEFSFPNNFEVKYDPDKTTQEEIMSLDVFLPYPATILSGSIPQASKTIQASCGASGCSGSTAGCGCGCGG
ncbi:MAG: copper ion binding protein [Candidatus Altiarchaeota archaeon]|nr:copper ion binding protein [Candidatus Altiarchaeota archaeon]